MAVPTFVSQTQDQESFPVTDIMSKEKRSRNMSRIRSENTTPERYTFALLDAAKLKYRRHDKSLPGKPDVVFPDQKVAVFVDGDYWHGWRFSQWQHRLPTQAWRDKIANTRLRDRRIHARLRYRGWKVIRIWEHQIETDVIACIRKIVASLEPCRVNWQAVETAYDRLPPLKRRNRLPKP